MPIRIAERYEVGQEVASGPLAVLSRGRFLGDGGFARPVAIRTLRASHASDRRLIGAWAAVASELALAASAHVEQVVDFIVEDDATYVVSEWIEGVSADAWLTTLRETGAPVPWPLAVEVAIEVLRGLADAHGHRTPLTHGAIGPATVRIAHDGTVKLIRFGAASALAATGAGRHDLELRGLQHSAPELLDGGASTAATDQHGVGQLLYTLLSGEALYPQVPGKDRDAALRAELPDLSAAREDLPPLLVASVERALRPEPRSRFASVGQMLAQLAQLLRSQPEPAGPEVLAASIRALWTERSGEHVIEAEEPEEAPTEDVSRGARALAASVQAMLGNAPAPGPARQSAIPIDGKNARPTGLPSTSTMHVDLEELTELYEQDDAAQPEPSERASAADKVVSRERTKMYEFGYKKRAQEQAEQQREAAAADEPYDDDDDAEPVPLTTRSGEHPLGLSPAKTEMLDADDVDLLTIPPKKGAKKRRAVPKNKRPTGIGRNETEMLDADALDSLRIDDD